MALKATTNTTSGLVTSAVLYIVSNCIFTRLYPKGDQYREGIYNIYKTIYLYVFQFAWEYYSWVKVLFVMDYTLEPMALVLCLFL